MPVWHLEARNRQNEAGFQEVCFFGTFEVLRREEGVCESGGGKLGVSLCEARQQKHSELRGAGFPEEVGFYLSISGFCYFRGYLCSVLCGV